MNHRYKLRQRITAMCMAAMMCCSMFPLAALAEENTPPTDAGSTVVVVQQTDETESDNGQSDASSPDPGNEAIAEDEQTAERASESVTESESAESNENAESESTAADEPEEVADSVSEIEIEDANAADIPGAELYADLPDSPAGSYMGSKGLPVAIGETKIGISEWSKSQLEEDSSGYLTAEVLNSDTAGETVTAGQIIGYVGSTGDSTGNHLHFEVMQNGVRVNPLGLVSPS